MGDQYGLSRRQMIKASAVAGAAAWTAPMIVDSLASPAAAASGSTPLSCSYVMIVFTYNGNTYSMKVDQGATACNGTNGTSGDISGAVNAGCGGHTYTNPGGTLKQDGVTIAAYPGSPACSNLFTVQGSQVVAGAGVTMIFSLAHDGSLANHFATQCPSGNTVALPC